MTSQIRALSVRQPWASLIASGRKTIELRSWRTDYRGPVLILAGSSPWRGDHGYELGPLGVALCVVDLVDCRGVKRSDAGAACIVPPDGFDFAWVLTNQRAVTMTPVKGKLGLYRPDGSLLASVGL